jgi:hypothetical protein
MKFFPAKRPTAHDKTTTIAFVTKFGKAIAQAIDDTGIFFPVAVAIKMDEYESKGSISDDFTSFVSDLKTKYGSTGFDKASSPEQQLDILKKAGLVLVSTSHIGNLNAAREVYKFGKISSTHPTEDAPTHVKRLGKQAETRHAQLEKEGKTKEKSLASHTPVSGQPKSIMAKLEEVKGRIEDKLQGKDVATKEQGSNMPEGQVLDPSKHGGDLLNDSNFNI